MLIHKSDGKNGVEEGTFLKLNWGVLIGIVVTIVIALFGIINTANTSAHGDLNTKMSKLVDTVTSLSLVVSNNCTDIAVLKSESSSIKEVLGKFDNKLDKIRNDQTEFYLSRGFKSKGKSSSP